MKNLVKSRFCIESLNAPPRLDAQSVGGAWEPVLEAYLDNVDLAVIVAAHVDLEVSPRHFCL